MNIKRGRLVGVRPGRLFRGGIIVFGQGGPPVLDSFAKKINEGCFFFRRGVGDLGKASF